MAQSRRQDADREAWQPGLMLAGKVAAPLVQPGTVTRARLLQQLDEDGARRLSVVVAPAGWGKTTLLAEWARMARNRDRVAWLTLEEADDEPNRFWTYLVTALRAVAPDLGEGALAALRVPGVDPLDVALPTLLNDVAASGSRHVLILDDYHVLTDVRIHEAVEFLLTYLPPSLHLVIAGRFDPPLPLARMRARGQLTEIRAADLRFTASEAAGLVSAVGKAEVDADALDVLVDRTEGWAVGLKLAALRSAARSVVMTGTSSTSSLRRCSTACLPTGGSSWSAPRPWIGSAARCVTRCSAAGDRRACWRRWSAPTCSSSHSTSTGSGTAITGCSETCFAASWMPPPRT
jgi:ATP/maltotriose-dependent transcriptional regulator MalT